MVFLQWASAPTRDDDPRLPAAQGAAPADAIPDVGHPCFATTDRSIRVRGVVGALSAARERIGLRDQPIRLVLGAADPAEMVSVACSSLRQPADDLVIVPPHTSGAHDLDALAAVLSAPSAAPTLLLLGAVGPTAIAAPFTAIEGLWRLHPFHLVLNATLAAWAPLPPLPFAQQVVVVAALDRWHAAPAGTWQVGDPQPWNGQEGNDDVNILEVRLRRRLAATAGVQVWTPLGEASSGLVPLDLEGWSGAEAAAVLRDSLGVELEVGPFSAVPLPGFGSRPALRISLAPWLEVADLDLACQALARVAAVRPMAQRPH